MTNHLMQLLEKSGIPTHFVEELTDRETAGQEGAPSCRWRSSSATSPPAPLPSATAWRRASCLTSPPSGVLLQERRPGRPPAQRATTPWPWSWPPRRRSRPSRRYAFNVNDVLKAFWTELRRRRWWTSSWSSARPADGTIVLADEISPDTCRFWDAKTHEKLDKDRFRRDLGGVEDAYHEIMQPPAGR